MIIIDITDDQVTPALHRLQASVADLSPVLRAIGEGIMARTKQRFGSASGPDGAPWAANKPSTIERYIRAKGGFGKRGLNKGGQTLAAGKKPLAGLSGSLADQFALDVQGDTLTVGSTMRYAAMQQFGGTRAQFPNLWGDLPPRPFLPVTAARELYPEERSLILAALNTYLRDAAGG